MSLHAVAVTGERFATFGEYVPSVNAPGEIAFQATLLDGGSDVVVGVRSALVDAGLAGEVPAVTSHPDRNARGDLCFYGSHPSGRGAVFLVDDGGVRTFAGAFHEIGPAGPTIDEAGVVAFRAERAEGVPGVHVVAGGDVRTLAERGETFEEFFGLPLATTAPSSSVRTGETAWRGSTEPRSTRRRSRRWWKPGTSSRESRPFRA